MNAVALAMLLSLGQFRPLDVSTPKAAAECKCGDSCPCKASPPKLNPTWSDAQGNRYETRSDGRHYLIVQRNVGTSVQVPMNSNCPGGVCYVPQQKRR